MSDYRLEVFEPFKKGDWTRKYRFAVINPNVKGYPANFVCLLPKRIFDSGKAMNVFARVFGDKSQEFAVELLKEALQEEKDENVKFEIEKRT